MIIPEVFMSILLQRADDHAIYQSPEASNCRNASDVEQVRGAVRQARPPPLRTFGSIVIGEVRMGPDDSTAGAPSALDAQQQKQSQQVTKRLVELFGDADQTNIRMQGSKFHSDSGKFSGVTDAQARDKLRAADLLLE
jgi:hypothetical protein